MYFILPYEKRDDDNCCYCAAAYSTNYNHKVHYVCSPVSLATPRKVIPSRIKGSERPLPLTA